jgi:hypothetical protein
MPRPTGQGFSSPLNQMIPLANNFQAPYARIQNMQRLHATQDATQSPTKRKCYNCEERGHNGARCPNLRSCPPLTPTSNSAPPAKRKGNANPAQGRQDYAQGWVNQLAIEEAQNVPMNGTFLINLDHVLIIPRSLFFSALRIIGARFLLRGSLVTPQNSEF